MKAKTFKIKNRQDNLCSYCEFCFADCSPSHILFGDGLGNDNVIECDVFTLKGDTSDIIEFGESEL